MNYLKRIVMVIMAVTMLFLAPAVVTQAAEGDELDFSETLLTIGKGQSKIITVTDKNSRAISGIYTTNAKSSGTCARILESSNGHYKVALYIGADETSTGVSFWFYLNDCDYHDNVDVRVSGNTASSAGTYAAFQHTSAAAIAGAAPGAVVDINTDKWISFDKSVTTIWAARPDVTVNVTFKTAIGTTCKISVPAGTNVAALADANGYIGFAGIYAAYAVPVN
ncbi:MAG: hypothetical protein KBH85_04025 [Lachnospiraceae bacterium]|jgi:hypothetical protein|nr:hypothetical protein [Lachnospiraceae bacterium]